MPGKKYDTDYMDSPIERGTPYKMNGHTLPGIKQNPRTKNMFAGEDGPFLKNGIGSKIKEGLGKVKNILSMSEKEKIDVIKLKKGVEAGAKVGGASAFQKDAHVKLIKGNTITGEKKVVKGDDLKKKASTGVSGDFLKTQLKKGYEKLKSMNLGGGKLAKGKNR